MFSLEKDALFFAIKAHDGQYRKESGMPYIVHPISVLEILKNWITVYNISFTNSLATVFSAALLHDTIEDVEWVTPAILEETFNSNICNMVFGLTKASMGSSLPREKRQQLDNDYLASQSLDVQIIKAADIYHNSSDILESQDRKWAARFVNEKLETLAHLTKIPNEIRNEVEYFLNECKASFNERNS